MEPISEDEKAVVEQLKKDLAENHSDLKQSFTDTTILRHYRGMKRKYDEALNSLVKHAQWRIQYDVDNIDSRLESFETELKAKKVELVDGFDKNGRPATFCYAHRHIAKQRNIEEVR